MKISRQFSFVILGASIVVIVATILVVYLSTTFFVKNLLIEREGVRSHNLMKEIDTFLYERYVDVQAYAGRQQLKDFLKNQPDPSQAAVITRQFKELQYISGVWENIELIAPSGTILISTDQSDIGANVSSGTEIGWEKQLAEKSSNGETVYSDVFISERTNQPTMIFSTPVWETSYGGRVVGVLMAHLNWSIILEKLEDAGDVGVHLFNRDGLEMGSNYFNRRDFILKYKIQIPHWEKILNDEIESEEGSHFHDNDSVLTSYAVEAGYLDYRGNNWVLLIETSLEGIMGLAYKNVIKIILILTFIVLIATIFILIFINKKIIKPVTAMSTVVSEIKSGGELKLMPPSMVGGEIGELALGLNSMIKRLQKHYSELENVIAEKTKDLQENVLLIKTQNGELRNANLAILNLAEDVELEKDNAKKEEEKIRTIIQGIGDGVFVIDTLGKIIIFNKMAGLISGFNPEEAVNEHYKDIIKFVLEKEMTPNDQFIEAVLASGNARSMTNHSVLIKKDGSIVSVADSASPLKDKDGKVIGCVVVFRDVTREREIDRAKTEFVSLASHQLRTPLSTIGWYAELLLSGDAGRLTVNQKKYIDEIYHGNKRMVELVNALLNVSRIEMGTFSIESVPSDIVYLVEQNLKELELLIKGRNIKLIKQFDAKLERINLDPNLMSIILHNLLLNSIRYTPIGGTIGVEIEKRQEDILLKISDTGYGIPKKDQPKIFTKLFRADNIRKKEADGTGLGLYIVKSILDHSGGRIWFESEENEGSIFYVSIPLVGMKSQKGTKVLGG